MRTSNLSLRENRLLTLLLVIMLTLFLGCPNDGGPGPEVDDGPVATPEQIAFYTAWIADCTADTIIRTNDSIAGMDTLLKMGLAQLTGAFGNTHLQDTFGNMGTAPSWGPSITVSSVKYSPFGSKGIVTDNLMFVAKSSQDTDVTYHIGIAGTNMVSPFGWFNEDFTVQTQVPWDASDANKGSIATGSMAGLDTLLSLRSNGQGILDYLSGEISAAGASTNITINVAGHSLGGALAPLMALYLRENISNTNCQVAAWAYAGPTPGDSLFASHMVSTLGADNYHAYINSRDIVPHVWEVDSLKQLCTIYADLQDTTCTPFGSTIIPGSIVPALVNWTITQSQAGGEYKIAGKPTSFVGTNLPINPTNCAKIEESFSTMKKYKAILPLYDNLTAIATTCKADNTESTDTNIHYFLVYMAEVGFQHSYPYMERFFPGEIAKVVEAYAQGGTGSSEGALYVESSILSRLVGQINAITTSSDCSCPN